MIKIIIITSLLIGLFIFFTGCSSTKKYDWLPTESAPENYPMQIVSGALICPDGYTQKIPNGKIFSKGWGKFVSTHIVGSKFKPLPDKLDITWFSYREDKFYSASVALPYEKIQDLFKEGYMDDRGEIKTYHRIMLGLAPGGYITVWLMGFRDVQRVAVFQADEADLPWISILDNPAIKREDFIKDVLEKRVQASSADKTEIPFTLWKDYEQEYKWQPQFELTGDIKNTSLFFFNGEQTHLNYESDHPLNTKKLNRKHYPIPKEIHYYWFSEGDKVNSRSITFSEEELVKAFKEFGPDSGDIKLLLKLNTFKSYTKVFLKSADKTIQLKEVSEKRAR